MFIDIDTGKSVVQPKYFLAKPNKTIIAPIQEAYGGNINLKLGNIHELTFSIPYFIEDNFEMVENPNVKLIKNQMLIKMVLDYQTEWFVVESIGEDGSDEEVFNVTAYSLGYELRGKRFPEYKKESGSPTEILTEILTGTAWRLQSVDPALANLYRTLDESSTNALDLILEYCETIKAVAVWNTNARELSIVEYEEYGSFKGMTADYGKLMENVSVERESSDLITRLHVAGSEDLTIHSVNPTGQGYIEDFSYYIYPFERDINRNVIKKSDFMSDALCHALLDQQKLIQDNSTQVASLNTQRETKIAQVVQEETELLALMDELDIILNELDLAKAVGDTTLIATKKSQRDSKNAEVSAQQAVVNQRNSELTNIENQLNAIYDNISFEGNYSQTLQDELTLFIKEGEWTDDRYINAQELYEGAWKEFEEYKVPKQVLSIGLVGLFNIVEESYYWDKLVLGDTLRIRHPRMNIAYYAKIVEIDINFEDGSINVTISNARKIQDGQAKFEERLESGGNASAIIASNKYKWNLTSTRVNAVEELMNAEYDAVKRKIIAGANNSVEISKRGIIVMSPQFPAERIVIQSGVIALSKNSGEDWQTAITPDGVVAERLMGTILAGQNLIITNDSGSLLIDNNGMVVDMDKITIRATGGGNAIDTWNTNVANHTQLRSEFNVTKGQISMVVSETNEIKAVDIASAISVTPDAISLISSETSMSGDQIVSSINIQPSNIKIQSKNLDLIGAVTFQSFDSTTQTRITSTEDSAESGKGFSGRILNPDATFQTGLNDVQVYNNTAGGGVAITRIAKPADAPTSSTHILEVTKTGDSNPAYGGFSFRTNTRANAIFVTRFIAKLPVGSSFAFATNSIGTGGSSKWLTSNEGTGKYEEYVYKVTCGSSGTFSSTNYFYVNSSAALPFTWQLAYATVHDATEIDATPRIVKGWGHSTDVTRIDGGNIYTGSISAAAIKTNELIVGTNVSMGANATISWGQVTSQPSIPNSADDIGALPANSSRLTYITSTGVYTGTLSANQITAGTISANYISGGTLSGSLIQGGTITGATFDASNAGMTSSGTTSSSVRVWAGASIGGRTSAPFRVLHDGTLYASNAYITGGQITGGTINIGTDAFVGNNIYLKNTYADRFNEKGMIMYSSEYADGRETSIKGTYLKMDIISNTINITAKEVLDLSATTLRFGSGMGVFFNGNQPEQSTTEIGYCGIGGVQSEHISSGSTFTAVGVNFHIRKSYTPSSIGLTTVTHSLLDMSQIDTTSITRDGFFLYMRKSGTSNIYITWRGSYSA